MDKTQDEGQDDEEQKEPALHIDHFPLEVKKSARKKALDTHPSFKAWVIDLFKAAYTGERHGPFTVVVDSEYESGQTAVRKSSAPSPQAGAAKTSGRTDRRKEKGRKNNTP